MKIVIDIPDRMYNDINKCGYVYPEHAEGLASCLVGGTPLPDGAEILTKEAYSDLCMRAADVPVTNVGDLISRQAAEEKLKKVVDEMSLIFADIREKNVDDSVCGLCEYDCDHGIDGFANECPGFERDDCFKLKEEYRKEWTDLSDIPSVDPERKPGKWVEGKCNRCGSHALFWAMATTYCCSEYCPKCGCKMEVDG